MRCTRSRISPRHPWRLGCLIRLAAGDRARANADFRNAFKPSSRVGNENFLRLHAGSRVLACAALPATQLERRARSRVALRRALYIVTYIVVLLVQPMLSRPREERLHHVTDHTACHLEVAEPRRHTQRTRLACEQRSTRLSITTRRTRSAQTCGSWETR